MTQVIADKLANIVARSGLARRPVALGIGAPGWIKSKEGIIVSAPNIPGWRDVPITKIMSEIMGLPSRLDNDANLYAFGEWLAGAGEGTENLVVLTLGTGVGGGLILNKRLWAGSFASAAEVGHFPYDPHHGSICGCGQRGCLETVASATGMIRLAKEWLASNKETLYNGSPSDINPAIMLELARRNDPMSLTVFKLAGEALGYTLATIFNLLGLEAAVIGGGAAGAFRYLESHIMEILGARLVTAHIDDIKVVKGTLGVNAPLVGAAAMMMEAGY
jgi:glucokinase